MAGILTGVSEADYFARPEISQSDLAHMAKSPLHFWYNKYSSEREKKESTEAQKFGTLLHSMALEPDKFDERYVVAPEGIDRRTKDGKATWAQLQDEAVGKTIIKADDFNKAKAMRGALLADPVLGILLNSDSEKAGRELTILWTDEATGLNCRGRVDLLYDGIAMDIKTTQDASPTKFRKSIGNFRYHVQAAFYIDGLKAVGCGDIAWLWGAIEKEAPYATLPCGLQPDALERGRQIYRAELEQVARCLDSGKWPSYSESIVMLDLAPWDMRDSEFSEVSTYEGDE